MSLISRTFYLITLLLAIAYVPSANAYSMLVDRFEVNGQIIDDFDDGLPGQWTNTNVFNTFGTWQDEVGTSFARIESPGLVEPSIFGSNAVSERSDIFSKFVPGGSVSGGSPFSALLTLDATLPESDQTYIFAINTEDADAIANTTLTETIVYSLANSSTELATQGGTTPGLTFGQFRVEYGPNLAITNISDIFFTSIAMPITMDTIQISMLYEETGGIGLLVGGYRFDSNGIFVNPLPAINSTIVDGFWDIGTAKTTLVPAVPVPAAIWLFGTALIGLIGFNSRRKAT